MTTIQLPDARSWDDVAAAALRESAARPGFYITAVGTFTGSFLVAEKRLNRQAHSSTSNTPLQCYWLNGVRRNFTTAQVAADQAAGHRN